MCYRPLNIQNPKRYRRDNYKDKARIVVPCGNCIDCLSEKRLSWFIRLSYEYQRCIDTGGFGFYITLTYNEKTVPRLGSDRVFRKKDIQNYIKALRKRIQRYLHLEKYDSKTSYFYSGEYCPTNKYKNTRRPHYHVLFFCNDPISKWVFRKYAMELWSKQYGFVKCGDNYGFIEGVGALHYCAKYVCKDVSNDNWCKHLHANYNSMVEDGFFEADLHTQLGVCIDPPHRASNDCGMYLLGCEDYHNLEQGFCILPDSKLGKRKYKLPLYFDHKIFYDVEKNENGNPCYILNDAGRKMKIARKKKFEESFKKCYTALMQQKGKSIYLDHINNKFKTNFSNYEQLQKFINKKGTFTDYCDYVTTYKGYAVNTTCLKALYRPNHSSANQHYLMHYMHQDLSNSLKESFDSMLHSMLEADYDFITDIIFYYTHLINLPVEEKKLKLDDEKCQRRDCYYRSTPLFS